jgi:hypothetical protein
MKKWLNRQFSKEEVQIQEKMLNFPGHKRYANEKYTKISSLPSYKSYLQEHKQQKMLARIWQNRNIYTLSVGIQISTTFLERIMQTS